MDKPGFVSLFTGVGGFDLGFEKLNMNCIGQCEIDRYANMVLQYHWPETKRISDVREIHRSTFVRPNLICGGFPCQDLSVAGKRKGLAGRRSGLFFEFERIVTEFKPDWFVIENVPGLLSSNEKRDFATVLRRLGKCGYLQAWRVFDSQYFGVAQRRRRVFIVGSLGNGRCAQVLFESKSLPGNPAQGRKKGEGVAVDVAPCLASSGGGVERAGESRGQDPVIACFGGNRTSGSINISAALNACGTASGRQDFETETFAVCFESRFLRNGRGAPSEIVPPLKAESGKASKGDSSPLKAGSFGVRRLTPKECERLQAFPDEWTRWGIDEKGEKVEISDTQRYKMLGNAVTVSVAEWIAARIAKFINE